MNPWELHPALVHFPLAFLLGAAIAQAWASRGPQSGLQQVAEAIASWGVVLGWAAAVAGVVAWLTLPVHSEIVHSLMFVHGGLALTGLVASTGSVMLARRGIAHRPGRWLAWSGAVLVAAAGLVGGWMVYRGGAGISPEGVHGELGGHPHSHSH